MQLFNTVTELQSYLDSLQDSLQRSCADKLSASFLAGFDNPQKTNPQKINPKKTIRQKTIGQKTIGQKTVGFVPTMGALHAGHLSLIEKARQTADIIVVSIFVNPLQFGPTEDFEQYPRPQRSDQEICQLAGVDALFMPSVAELYGSLQADPLQPSRPKLDLSTLTQVVPPPSLTSSLCGRSRPTHFQGVATVVTKLLNVVRPTYAFFGQKDAQQVAIIKRLVKDLNLPGQIVVCPIVREPDGLALSSRNQYLSATARQKATLLYQALQAAKGAFAKGERSASSLIQAANEVLSAEPTVTLDYLALVHPDTLEPLQAIEQSGMMAIAAYFENSDSTHSNSKTRLIDNILLEPEDETAPEHNDKKALRRKPIIAIDGPAGAGKSTVARQVAFNLGLIYLDTGAMYRALTWFVMQQGIDPADADSVAQQLANCNIQLAANLSGDRPLPPIVKVNGQDVTAAIRTPEVTAQVSTIAAQSAVRENLVEQQQAYGTLGGVVADGRDIGTHVFPEAELKIYLTASVKERAARRYRDLEAAQQGVDNGPSSLPTLEELAQLIAERDRQDSTRAVSPLRKAPDAIEIVTDDLSAQQVIEKISTLYQELN